MIKHVMCIALFLGCAASVQAAPQDYWPNSVQYFVDDSISERELRIADRLMRETDYSVYDVTFATRKNREFADSIPKSIIEQGEEATDAYIRKHVIPEFKESAPEIATSKVGLSLLKIYGVDRLPAVVIDGRYVTYGLSVGDSVKEFQWYKHREEQ